MRKVLLMSCLLTMICFVSIAQSVTTVVGKVTDEKKVPLEGATIVYGKLSVVTDENGGFKIDVSDAVKTISVYMVGYEMKQLPVSSRMSVILDKDDSHLSDVVVIGYGTQKKTDATSSIAVVAGKKIADLPVPSFDAALAGRASGVQITSANGVMNNPPVFRIRGTNSISLSSYPLIVIDGVPTFTGSISNTDAANNPLSSISPADIESLSILKDAAATAIYGSRAANGVVIITTKRGKTGKAKVNYDGWVGWTKGYRFWQPTNAQEMMDTKNEGLVNAGLDPLFFPSYDAAGNVISTNWGDYIFRTGLSHSHNVNISGGNEATKYFFAAGYTKQEGIIVKNDFTRKNMRFNIDHKVSNYISLGGNMAYSNEVNTAVTSSGSVDGAAFATAGLGRLAISLPANVAPYNEDGSYNINGTAVGSGNNKQSFSFPNPLVYIDNNAQATENNHIQGNLYFQVKPIKDVTLKTSYGVDYLNVDNLSFTTPIMSSAGGAASGSLAKYKRWLWTNTGQYEHVFANAHSLSFLVGTEQQYTDNYGFGLSRQGIVDNYYSNINGGWSIDASTATNGNRGENYLVSGFARLNYDFKKKYFIGASIRRDGYSAFADGKKYGNFWSISGAYDISKEKFWEQTLGKTFDYVKLRASYGTVGNISGIADFASFSLYGTGLYNGNPSLGFSQAGNPDLTWETSKKFDVGVQFGLFDNVLTGDLAYYNNNVDGLIVNLTQAGSTGVPNAIPTNVGSLYNRGLEASFTISPKFNGDFNWTTSLNFTYNKNEVTSLAPGLENITTATSGLETINITQPGYSLGYLYVMPTAGVDPSTGRRIFLDPNGRKMTYSFLDRNTQPYSYEDGSAGVAPQRVLYKNSMPKFYGGWDNTFSYKAFDLGVMITYQGGFYVYNGTRATGLDNRPTWMNIKEVTERWQNPGDITDVPKIISGDNVSNGSANPISDNVQKGDFIKLRNVSLGYRLPTSFISKMGISNARIYASAQNLAIITSYGGPDPEVSSNGNGNTSQGVDKNSVPNARTITVGLNISF